MTDNPAQGVRAVLWLGRAAKCRLGFPGFVAPTSGFSGGPEVSLAAAGKVLFWGHHSSEKPASRENRRATSGAPL